MWSVGSHILVSNTSEITRLRGRMYDKSCAWLQNNFQSFATRPLNLIQRKLGVSCSLAKWQLQVYEGFCSNETCTFGK